MKLEIAGKYSASIYRVAAVAALGLVASLAAAQASGEKGGADASPQSTARKSAGPQAGQETFPSAAEASHALVKAIRTNDQAALLKVLGPDAKEIISSGDDAEDKQDRDEFVQKFRRMHRLVIEPDGSTTLYIGAENWPTPIPLMHKGDAWYFDTQAGKQEILYRRVGKNELAAIQVCRELVDAEKEYDAQPHDGDKNPQYAQKFFSDPGRHNGLYWETASGETTSPIGPLVASAANEGYNETDQQPQPFQGYYFRILKGQGAKAPGGSRTYIVDGKMTRGFAFVAYPAEYRSSGVMTFMVNQDGIIVQKDLGGETAKIVDELTEFNPNKTWDQVLEEVDAEGSR